MVFIVLVLAPKYPLPDETAECKLTELINQFRIDLLSEIDCLCSVQNDDFEYKEKLIHKDSSTNTSASNEENFCEVTDKTIELEKFNDMLVNVDEKEEFEIELTIAMPKHHEYFCTPDKLMKCLQPYKVLDPVLEIIELQKAFQNYENSFKYEASPVETEINLDCHCLMPENLELEDDLVQLPNSNEAFDNVLEMEKSRNVTKQVK